MGDFWRAYEWSAWLIAVITYNDEVRMRTKDRKPLHVTRMRRTDIEGTYCFVGFPIKSVEKYIPQRNDFESVDDKHVYVTVTLPRPTDSTEVTFERLKSAVEQWKESVELTERKEKDKKPASRLTAQAGTGLLSQIMAYPLTDRTALENIQFIASLKEQISAIL